VTSRLAVLTAITLALTAGSPPADLSAQDRDPIPLSQYQMVTQSLGWAEISVEYRRPVARGRVLFGNLVSWDKTWTPAADSAAVFTVSEDVLVAGQPVPAGSYSLWLVPRAEGPWTLVLSRAARVFHAPYPEGEDLMRVEVTPESGDHMEALAFYFPVVEGRDAVLRVHWGNVIVPIPIHLR